MFIEKGLESVLGLRIKLLEKREQLRIQLEWELERDEFPLLARPATRCRLSNTRRRHRVAQKGVVLERYELHSLQALLRTQKLLRVYE